MDNNFKKISKQIEKNNKAQVNLIKDSLENSRTAIDNIRQAHIDNTNLIKSANLASESLKDSMASIDAIRSAYVDNTNLIKSVNLASESLKDSMAGIANMRRAYIDQVNLIKSVNLASESLKDSMASIDNLRASYMIPSDFVSMASLTNNNLNAVAKHVQDSNILKYASIIGFINNLDLNSIVKKYENRFFGRYNKEFDLFIRNSGWLIPNCASEDFIDSLYLSFDNNQNIDKKFVEYFSDDDFRVITELREKWDLEGLIPKGNLKIIFNAINLILNDNGYEYPDIIIPPLLAQIDVLISEVLLKNDYREINRKFYSDVYGSKDKSNIRTFREDFAENIIDNWEEHHVNFLLENLFANNYGSELEKNLIDNFNRHNIMHGLDNEYGTFENVIRCLLVIDFLNDFLSDDSYYRLN